MPRWMAARPHLAGRLLVWRNCLRYQRRRIVLTAALILGGIVVVAGLPPTGPSLEWLGRNWAVAFVIVTCVSTLATARRRQRAAIEAATSWLAALPVGRSVWLSVVAATAAGLGAIVGFAALMAIVGAIDRSAFLRLAIASAAGAIVGLLAGWRLQRAGIGAPGFHYAIVRRPRARWASAPALWPLANWPAAQGRIFSRPKRTAPALLFALMAIPMGSPGQAALAVAGLCMALFGVFSLAAAAVRVAFGAARWLAPTALGRWRFTAALIWRVVLTQALALTVLILLAGAIDPRRAVALCVPLAAIYLCASLAVAVVAAFTACRRAGLGASGRGA